jgi:hypothetical protein
MSYTFGDRKRVTFHLQSAGIKTLAEECAFAEEEQIFAMAGAKPWSARHRFRDQPCEGTWECNFVLADDDILAPLGHICAEISRTRLP